MSTLTGIDKDALARVVAADIPPGSFVNLGIGLPTRISNHLLADSGVMLHTENGMLGMGPEAQGEAIDPDLVNAGKLPVTELPGASYFHHADSFAMMRGGHLDICVLGAYQVSAAGDLANWHTGQPGDIPAVGGAMDLAIGARQTFVMMTLLTRDGRPKLVPECTYPLTGLACVSRVYTDLAVFQIEPGGIVVRDLFGVGFAELTSSPRRAARRRDAGGGLMMRSVTRTTVGIVGGGPAGLMLSHLLSIAGIESVVVDHRTRAEIENTVRAGILEADSVRLLIDTGVSDRVHRDGIAHQGIDLRFGGENHRIDFKGLVGEPSWLYPQTDVFIDLADARDRDGGDVRFGVSDTRVVDVTSDRPGILFTDADGAELRGALRLPGRRRRIPVDLPLRDPGVAADALLPRVPVRLVRHPGRGAQERARARLHPLAPRLRADQPAHRDTAADVLPVRPGGRRERLVR